MKIYTYAKCGTCRKAVKFLEAQGLAFEVIPIREQPPTLAELRRMLAHHDGNIKKLCNTSGVDYRALKLGEKLPAMSIDQAFALLTQNGNLVKRPFLVTDRFVLNGFREEEWLATVT